jgi:pyruvate/2-oxoglutarate dehydrogenase complex dihydrolipoamide acyltransferase (E2) component
MRLWNTVPNVVQCDKLAFKSEQKAVSGIIIVVHNASKRLLERIMNDPFEVRPYPKIRYMTSETLRAARQKNIIHGFIEVDVTLARRWMREHKSRTGESPSFTAFILTCMARAIAENPSVQAYRVGGKLYLFENVDITTQIEREKDGQKLLATHIVRAANEKTFWQIHDEIRKAQHGPLEEQEVRRIQVAKMKLPNFLLRLYWWKIKRDIHLLRKFGAMAGLTAVGMFGDGAGWGLPMSFHSVGITVGGIGDRLVMVDGQLENREYLCLTLSFDHDILDGAPAARFASRLKELIENGHEVLAQDTAGEEGETVTERTAELP